MNFTIASDLAADVADRLEYSIRAALAERGAAWLALAGGRTSPPVFRRLSERIGDWSNVLAVPTDERWVPHHHPDCNLAAAKAAFADVRGLRWVTLTPAEAAGVVDAIPAEEALALHPEPFDVVLLGMGADGHFASLFPGADNLTLALDPAQPKAALAIVPRPMPSAGPFPRITLSLSRLLNSRRVVLAISGEDKRATLERAYANGFPVAALIEHCPNLEVVWSA